MGGHFQSTQKWSLTEAQTAMNTGLERPLNYLEEALIIIRYKSFLHTDNILIINWKCFHPFHCRKSTFDYTVETKRCLFNSLLKYKTENF